MRNSVAAGRRLAARVVLLQLGATLVVALGFCLAGWRDGVAALAAGTLVAIGNALLAVRAFGAFHGGGGYALARLIAGSLLKWVLVIVGMVVLIVPLGLPPVAVLCGLGAALLANLAAFRVADN